MPIEHISPTETAKLIRRTLRREHPAIKFSVRTSKYAGGASVNVRWTDGPTEFAIRKLLAPFAGQGFDGSIDLAYHRHAWLHDDGTVTFAETSGTAGSRGAVDANYAPPADMSAQLVSFGAHYVGTRRELSDEFEQAALDAAAALAPRLHVTPGNQCRACFRPMVETDDARVARERDRHRVGVCSPECVARVEVRWGHLRPSTRKVRA